MTIEEMRRLIVAAAERAKATAAAAETEKRELTDTDRKSISAELETIRGLKASIQRANDDSALLSSLGDLSAPASPPAAPPGAREQKSARAASAGQAFLDSPQWKSFTGTFPDGRIPDSFKGIQSGAVQLGGFKELVTGGSPTSGGAFVLPEQYPYVDAPGRPLVIRDLCTSGTTGSDTVEYVRFGTRTVNAAPVPEATSAGAIGTGGVTAVSGGLKPESGFDLQKVTATVKTLAHWIPATKRALSDAAQVRTLIDAFLRDGLAEVLEDQIVLGDGVGENFEGVLRTPGTTAQPFDTDVLTTLRRAKTKVRTLGRRIPTAYVLNPEDNENIDLIRETAAGGQFLFGGPTTGSTPTLWGLPRLESEAIPVGTAVVADWSQAVLWDREQTSVQVSDSHADFFVRNLVAFLAELRAAFGILRPAAFVEVDLTSA